MNLVLDQAQEVTTKEGGTRRNIGKDTVQDLVWKGDTLLTSVDRFARSNHAPRRQYYVDTSDWKLA